MDQKPVGAQVDAPVPSRNARTARLERRCYAKTLRAIQPMGAQQREQPSFCEDSDSDDLKNFGRKLQDVSDDSEDEGGKLPTMPKVVDLSSKDEVTKQMKALGKTSIEDRELKIQNVIAFNQRRRQNMLKEMIASAQGKGVAKKMTETAVHKKSFNENFKNEPVKFKEILGKRIEKKKKVNLAKINKIKIRTKKV